MENGAPGEIRTHDLCLRSMPDLIKFKYKQYFMSQKILVSKEIVKLIVKTYHITLNFSSDHSANVRMSSLLSFLLSPMSITDAL